LQRLGAGASSCLTRATARAHAPAPKQRRAPGEVQQQTGASQGYQLALLGSLSTRPARRRP